jgi:uncharacterized repeat protein (TIGR01451 family)
MVPVHGNGSYTTMGFQLPTSGTVAGNYLWVSSYSGDGSNNPIFRDTDEGEERATVIDPTPTLVTTASPTTVTLGPNGATLTDTARLSGGFFPTGDIVFELFFNGGSDPVFTQAVTVNGNGNYTTSFTLPSTGPAGVYQWVAVYGGDPNNNSVATVLGDEPVTVRSPEADLLVTKMVNKPQVNVGSVAVYTLTVHNNGPDAATGVVLTDPLPAGLALVGAVPSQGTFSPAGDVWTVGTLPAGATAVLTVSARVTAVGTFVNTATVTGDQFDPDLSNNHASASVVGGNLSKRLFLGSHLAGSPAAHAQHRRFVSRAFRALLGRQADPAELAQWSALLDRGTPRAPVVLAIEDLPEYRADQVDAAYARFLHHTPDQAAEGALVAFLSGGGTVEQLQALLAGSPEYFQDHGGTDAGFLEALYSDGMGRAIDARSLARWSQDMANGMTPGQVATAVFSSAAYDRALVLGLYRRLLHRPAGAAAVRADVARLRHGARDEQIIAAILAPA